MEDKLLLPTPPRSPQRNIYYDNDDEDENMLEDFINLLNEDNFSDLFEDKQKFNRKRKIDDHLFADFDKHFGDVATSLLATSSNSTDPSELIDHLLSFENSIEAFDSPPPTNPPSPIKQETHDDDFFRDFDNFDSFEKLAQKPQTKRLKLDSESSDYFQDDSIWANPSISPLFNNFGEFFEDEDANFLDNQDVKPDLNQIDIEVIKLAFNNDHSYAMTTEQFDDIEYGEIEIKNEVKEFNFDKITKKTKILVPLKHLMETLQQKSYLVSPLGPGKKVIRLTGNDSVKGVLQSSALLTVSKPASQHNVRKRPHNPLLTRYTSPKLEEPVTAAPTTPSTSSSLTHPTKKKTKAHNNMERMRRIDLRNSFDNLKKLVPILSKSPKCSKVEILRKAEEYIRGLRIVEKKLVKEEQQLKVKLQQLKLKIECN